MKDPTMHPLPTFRPLVTTAVAAHLAAIPSDGSALVLASIAPVTPLLDSGVARALQHAQVSLDGAVEALTTVRDYAPAAARLGAALRARHAYHVALMAYFGVEVP